MRRNSRTPSNPIFFLLNQQRPETSQPPEPARKKNPRWLLSGGLSGLLALVGLTALCAPQQGAIPAPDASTFFESKIRPLLFEKCFGCHGEKQQRGGLRLDSRESLMRGGASGPVVLPGQPEQSALITAVHYTGRLKMPPAGKLAEAEIALLTEWVQRGANWTSGQRPEAGGQGQKKVEGRRPEKKGVQSAVSAARWWAFQPVRMPRVPHVVSSLAADVRRENGGANNSRKGAKTQREKSADMAVNPIDAFILAKLKEKGLKPAPPADRRTLIRRATFDLTGLPPTPEEVEAFVKDTSPRAWEKVVDRLLASPHYGERWGRHWLDVVRYCDSLDARGLGGEGDISDAWRYRDWVVNALNRDMPYSQFMMYQIAGDLMPPSSVPPPNTANITVPVPHVALVGAGEKPKEAAAGTFNREGIIATSMLAIGNWGNGDADKDKILTDIVDDQIDVISRGFMGLTVACARCHDHKFDPISTKDYYGLAGIFFSTHILPKLTPKGAGETPLRVPLTSPQEMAERQQHAAQTAELEKRIKAERETRYAAFVRGMLPQTSHYLTAVCQYEQRPEAQSGLSLAEYAKQRGLQEYALRQWRSYLGMGSYRRMNVPNAHILNTAGIFSWRGPGDCPSLVVNTNKEAKMLLTFTLPPHSVAVHPGPKNGVAVAWQSPISGVVSIRGKVADADPAGGDGIAWALDHRSEGGGSELASGEIPNGGAQDFATGKNADTLKSLAVRAGERIELLVLPKAEYTCDTTVVELTISTADGKKQWDITRDLLSDPLKANPHPDSGGLPNIWSFEDMEGGPRASKASSDPAIARWQKGLQDIRQVGAQDRSKRIENLAQEVAPRLTLTDARSPFWINRPEDEAALPAEDRTALAQLVQQQEELKKRTPSPIQYANAAQEGGVPESPHAGIHDVPVHIRGSYARLGDMVPRHFPTVLAGEKQAPITQGSGRLQLAQWLASDSHPLTARVIVNRVWQHHFGAGIVRTPSNFGLLGERPTHPELLDWLAATFCERSDEKRVPSNEKKLVTHHSALITSGCGWSLKKLHKLIMLSATYRQSSQVSVEAMQKDPDNRLFGRMNRQRLEAEAIRDNLLAVTGKLDQTMGGVGYRDFNVPRRTLYLMTVRSDRSGFGPLFDMADSTAPSDKRTISTVAPQSLFLLNSPFVLMQAKALAERLQSENKEGQAEEEKRIQKAYWLLYGRSATPAESKVGERYLALARQTLANPKPAGSNPGANFLDADRTAWEAYAQILLCANEFIYID